MYADAQRVDTATVASGGTGYAVGNVLAIAGGRTLRNEWSEVARFEVSAVDGAGAITELTPLAFGCYRNPPALVNSPTGGNGSGASLELTTTLYWDHEDWVTVPATSLRKVLTDAVLAKCDVNLPADGTPLPPGAPVDPGQPTRAQALIDTIVAQVRQAVKNGVQVPLSETAGTVPPEAELHVLNLAAWQLVNSTPNLQMAVITEKGAYAPPGQLAKTAQQWIDDVKRGKIAPAYPSDPDPAWQPGVKVGSSGEVADLSSYPARTDTSQWRANLGQL